MGEHQRGWNEASGAGSESSGRSACFTTYSRSENVCVAVTVCPTASVAISVIGVLATQGSGVSSMRSGCLDIERDESSDAPPPQSLPGHRGETDGLRPAFKLGEVAREASMPCIKGKSQFLCGFWRILPVAKPFYHITIFCCRSRSMHLLNSLSGQ